MTTLSQAAREGGTPAALVNGEDGTATDATGAARVSTLVRGAKELVGIKVEPALGVSTDPVGASLEAMEHDFVQVPAASESL